MADQNEKHPRNVAGKYFNDETCIDCGMCPEIAPLCFARDDEGGYSFVIKQPENEVEEALVLEAMEACPTESIGDDG